jgi:hypothetical protein
MSVLFTKKVWSLKMYFLTIKSSSLTFEDVLNEKREVNVPMRIKIVIKPMKMNNNSLKGNCILLQIELMNK